MTGGWKWNKKNDFNWFWRLISSSLFTQILYLKKLLLTTRKAKQSVEFLMILLWLNTYCTSSNSGHQALCWRIVKQSMNYLKNPIVFSVSKINNPKVRYFLTRIEIIIFNLNYIETAILKYKKVKFESNDECEVLPRKCKSDSWNSFGYFFYSGRHTQCKFYVIRIF